MRKKKSQNAHPDDSTPTTQPKHKFELLFLEKKKFVPFFVAERSFFEQHLYQKRKELFFLGLRVSIFSPKKFPQKMSPKFEGSFCLGVTLSRVTSSPIVSFSFSTSQTFQRSCGGELEK